MDIRLCSRALVVVGGIAIVATTATLLFRGATDQLVAVILAMAWYVAGYLAVRARPDHMTAMLMVAVGSCHATAYALASLLLIEEAPVGPWTSWTVAVGAGVLYCLGFAALGLLLALYPDATISGRRAAVLSWSAVVVAVLAPVVTALSSGGMPVVLRVDGDSVPAPSPLPLISTPVDLLPLVMLVLPAGLLVLVLRTRRMDPPSRRQLRWFKASAALLILMIIGTPAGTGLLGERTWSYVFVIGASAIPFAILAGVSRYRALGVDLAIARTLAYGALAVLVLSVVAASAAFTRASLPQSGAVASVVVLVAAVAGDPLRRRLELLADRWITGSRVRGERRLRVYSTQVGTLPMERVLTELAHAVSEAMAPTWVTVRGPSGAATVGHRPAADPPACCVPVRSGDLEFAAVEVGPRHGGWGEDDRAAVAEAADRAALALHNAQLTLELARRVEELTLSRARIVRAQDSARRDLERDLHDGVQQQLVALLVRLETLRSTLPTDSAERRIVDTAHQQARDALVELRELVQGLMPAVLADRGVLPALRSRVAKLPLTVTIDADPRLEDQRFPDPVENAVYYAVSEGLTNVIKHSGAGHARVAIEVGEHGALLAAVSDDGRGFEPGADDLAALRDRVEAVGGTLHVRSSSGVGTTVETRFPVGVDTHV